MKKILFATDLDNTLLFSHKRRRPGDICAEILDGAEQSFMTPETWDLLPAVSAAVTLLPVTTRSIAQYQRIRWPAGARPDRAVAANGGVLLSREVPDPDWLADSLRDAAPYQARLACLYGVLPNYPWCLRRKMVDGLYLFAVCPEDRPAESCMDSLRSIRACTGLTVEPSGRKLYFFPPNLHKGAAVSKARKRFQSEFLIAAGDSVLDLPMLRQAGLALVPDGTLARLLPDTAVRVCPQTEPFSNFVLRTVLDFAARHP